MASSAAVVPFALGRTAEAFGGLADTGLLIRLTRGRLWIGVLGALLVGIVALNVGALSFSASSSRVGRQADALERENSALRAKIANQLSNDNLQQAVDSLGLVAPEPGTIRYLRARPSDAKTAADRLGSGELSAAGSIPTEASSTTVPTTTVAPTTPAAPATTPIAP